jgi:predicted porin
MNKKLIALAIAGAFAAPVAMADSGNVVIYGVASVSYDNVNGTSTGSGGVADETRSRISSNNSYIGFKGSEDLGNGLSAIWQIENAVALDQQDINNTSATATTGTQSRRNTFAGISSKTMGNLTFGVQDTPLKTSTGPLDVFKDTLADYRATFAI